MKSIDYYIEKEYEHKLSDIIYISPTLIIKKNKITTMKQPESIEAGAILLRQLREKYNNEKNTSLLIKITSQEFTSLCPTTGLPDFYNIEIKYIPVNYYLEAKSIKMYLWSFRNYGIHCEPLSEKIATDIAEQIECDYVEITLTQFAGGITKGMLITSNCVYKKK